MFKRRAVVLFLVMLMLALPVVAAAASAVEFEDNNLQAAVIKEFENLGKVVEKSKIPQADMKLLKKINANSYIFTNLTGEPYGADLNEVIRDLTGLEYALKLDALDISYNLIKDLAPIRNLPLSYLNIKANDAKLDDNGTYVKGTPAFSYNPSSPQMRILQEIQHRGAVVKHDGLVKRISGPDRYQTAIRIWQNMYIGEFVTNSTKMSYKPCNTIVLARGDDFADALAGAPLAYTLFGDRDALSPPPILLTTSNKLHPATKAALISYIEKFEGKLTADPFNGVFDVYVLGGTAAISEAVVNELIYAIETEFEALDVRAIRLGGDDRYETAVAIAEKIDELTRSSSADADNGEPVVELVFASGENDHFADALAAASYAAYYEVPILLTRGDKLPGCVVDFLKGLGKDFGEENLDAVVAGGAAAVSENVISQLTKLEFREAGKNLKVFDEVTRVWGADRYATAVKLAEHYGMLTNDKINDDFFIATGDDFADALTGAVLACWGKNTGILLVKQDTIPGCVEKAINFQDKTTGNTGLTILGGEAAVSLNNAVKMYNLVRYPAWAPR